MKKIIMGILMLMTCVIVLCTVDSRAKEKKTTGIYVEKGDSVAIPLKKISKYKLTASNKKVVVTKKGKIKAKKTGKCTVKAKRGKKCFVYKVSIVNKLRLDKQSITLLPEESYQLKFSIGNKKGKWKSSDEEIVSVNNTGKVTAKKAGSCTVSIICSGKKYECEVKVPAMVGKWISVTINGTVREKYVVNGVYYYVLSVTDKENYGYTVTVRCDRSKEVYEYEESTNTYGAVDKKAQIAQGDHLKVSLVIDITSGWKLADGAEIEPYNIYLCK